MQPILKFFMCSNYAWIERTFTTACSLQDLTTWNFILMSCHITNIDLTKECKIGLYEQKLKHTNLFWLPPRTEPEF